MTADTILQLFFALVIGHALADFALQSDAMAKGKNRHSPTAAAANQKFTPCWPYWMSAHCLIHAGTVWAVTSRIEFGLVEFINHWITDFLKCEGKFGPHADQFIHVATKIGYVAIIWSSQ